MLLNNNEVDKAVELLEKIVDKDPCNVWAFEKLGDICLKSGKLEMATTYYKEAHIAIKCNTSGMITLEDHTRISKSIKKAHLKSKDQSKEEKKEEGTSDYLIKKGDSVKFTVMSILYKKPLIVHGIVEEIGFEKSKILITRSGGSLYLEGKSYFIQNSLFAQKKNQKGQPKLK
ncbi:MAG: hypothetical protein HQK84_11215 [Nitrospinae bacterium]|nr:hypothetical protein [Nitrospinota bacterium]